MDTSTKDRVERVIEITCCFYASEAARVLRNTEMGGFMVMLV